MAASRWLVAVAGALVVLGAGEARAAKDTRAPKIEHTAVTEATAGEQLTIKAQITDQSEIFEPTLYYRATGAKKYLTASMLKATGGYTAQIPNAATKADVEYFIEAYDALGNGPARFASDGKPQRVKVTQPPVQAVAKVPEPPPADAASGGEASPEKELKLTVVEASGGESAPVDTGKQAAPAADLELRDEAGPGLSPMKIAGVSAAGVGVVALVAGTVFGVSSRSLNEEARTEPSALLAQQKLDDARTQATRANVALVAGGALAVGGAILALLPDSPAKTAPLGSSAQLLIGPTGAGVRIGF